jgi:hypothetical protein
MRGPLLLVAVVLVGVGAFFSFSRYEPAADAPEPAPVVADAGETAVAMVSDIGVSLPTMRVFKSPTCGCCGDWITHLREHGFEVEVVDTNDLVTVKTALGIPPEMGSCHTAEIGDYVVEGHVPAADIAAFMAEAPDARGLAVPGMPVGSPGMEIEGAQAQPYDVMTIAADGSTSVFRSYR